MLADRLCVLYGEQIIHKKGQTELELDLSEQGVACITKFINAQNFIAIDKKALEVFDKLLMSAKMEDLLSPSYLPNDKKLTLKKICDAIVFCTHNNRLIVCMIEVKRTIGHRTYKNDIIPQLEISFYKVLMLLSLVHGIDIKDIPVAFIAIGSFAEKDREMVETAKLDNEYQYNRFLRTGVIKTKIPSVLNADALHSNFRRDLVYVHHRELNEVIDVDLIMKDVVV